MDVAPLQRNAFTLLVSKGAAVDDPDDQQPLLLEHDRRPFKQAFRVRDVLQHVPEHHCIVTGRGLCYRLCVHAVDRSALLFHDPCEHPGFVAHFQNPSPTGKQSPHQEDAPIEIVVEFREQILVALP